MRILQRRFFVNMFGSRQFNLTRITRPACGKQCKSCTNTEQVSVLFHELIFNDWVPLLQIRKYFFRILVRISGTLILTFGAGSGFTLLLFPIMVSFILRSFTVGLSLLWRSSMRQCTVYFIFCICRFLKTQAESLELPWKITECVAGKPIFVLTWEGTEPSLPSVMLNSHTGQLETYCWERGGYVLASGVRIRPG